LILARSMSGHPIKDMLRDGLFLIDERQGENPIVPKFRRLRFGFGFRLGFSFFILRQAQGAQPMHVLNGGRVARRFLLQCLIDFRFSPLIAV